MASLSSSDTDPTVLYGHFGQLLGMGPSGMERGGVVQLSNGDKVWRSRPAPRANST